MNSISVSGKNWLLKDFNQEDVNFIKENFSLDEITSKLLAIRKIKREDIKSFINPSIRNILPNPNILKDMEKTTLRVIKAIQNQEKIAIYGDYDVDGATSTAMLMRYFNHIKQNVEIYIPDRKKEGYGPNIDAFQKLINKGVNLIFTVDCGTLSFDPINLAHENKVDVLVLDHHQSEVKLPNAFSIINPNRLDDKSNLNYLCAAGVCFMFLVSLNRELRNRNWFVQNNIDEPNLINYLDLVSLGTICDVVPLLGLNRVFVKQGLKIIKSKTNLGLKTLLDICKIESNPTTYHLGYVIGPRINAGGRVGKCSHGANLLSNINSREVFKMAVDLDNYNKERQEIEKKLLQNILNEITDTVDPVIVLSGTNWHEGIIGIIASRIKDKFNKPTIIISIDNNIGKASARSIYGFDIGSFIIGGVQNGLLLKGGGHKMAGGFSIDVKKIDEFKVFINSKFIGQNIDFSKEKKMMIDSVISPAALNENFYKSINLLSPFGSGNLEPRFMIKDVKSISSKIVGEKHIKSLLLGEDGSSIKSIAFNALQNNVGSYLMNKNSKSFHIVGKMHLNEWKGQKNVEFIIDDISVNKTIKNTVPSSIG